MTSLDEYLGRLKAEQSDIYYLCAPSRELAMESPYFEMFKKADKEVIFVYSAIDDFVMTGSCEHMLSHCCSLVGDPDVSKVVRSSLQLFLENQFVSNSFLDGIFQIKATVRVTLKRHCVQCSVLA